MNSHKKLMIDVTWVNRLIADQFPRWQNLSVRAVTHGGWDNHTFRSGDDMLVRMPSAEYPGQIVVQQI